MRRLLEERFKVVQEDTSDKLDPRFVSLRCEEVCKQALCERGGESAGPCRFFNVLGLGGDEAG